MVSLLNLIYPALSVFLTGLAVYGGNSNNDFPEEELVRRAKNGDSCAFDRLVTAYQERVYFTVIRIVLTHEDARDVVQESFIKAYRNLKSFKEGYRFYTWLYRISVNTALNHIQNRKKCETSLDKLTEEKRFDPAMDVEVDEAYERSEMLQSVKTALKVVPHDMRAVFILRVYEGMKYQEIAETLELSIGTVMSRLHRARGILKQQLEKIGWQQNGT